MAYKTQFLILKKLHKFLNKLGFYIESETNSPDGHSFTFLNSKLSLSITIKHHRKNTTAFREFEW